MRVRLGALILLFPWVSWPGNGCSGGGDSSAGEARRGRKQASPAAESRTVPSPRSLRATPGSSTDRERRAPRIAPKERRWTTTELLGATESLVLPAPAGLLARQAALRYWRLSPYRHSRLPEAQRPVEVLLTLVDPSASRWLAERSEEAKRPGAAASGSDMPTALGPKAAPAQGTASWPLKAGPRKRWPRAVGAHEVRRALLLPPGSRWTARIRVPAEADLRFELSPIVLRRAFPTLRVTVTARPEGRPALELLSKELGPHDEGRFLPFRRSLGALAGQTLLLEVAVSPVAGRAPPSTPGVVALVRPRLESPSPGGPLNVMVLILDTVRLDALGSSGQKRVLTPALDALAARGVRFANDFTNAPWTRPSLMSLLSARHPGAAGSTPMSFYPHDPDRNLVRSGAVATLGDHLERQGYLVRALAQNYFMLPEEKVGLDLGFSSFAHVLLPGGPYKADNPTLTAAAEQFLAAHRDHRFFLYLHYESAHAPYMPPKEVLDRLRALLGPKARLSIDDKYRGEVMILDGIVARLADTLEKLGLRERTLLVVTSDHGETLDRAHCFLLPKLTYNTCYGHSPSLYDEVLRVPLFLVGPGLSPGKVVTQTTRHVDLGPTLLDWLGLPPLPGAEGVSVAPWLRGDRADEPREVYAVGRGVFALRREPWKYIWRAPMTRKRVVKDKELEIMEELYDLRADPQEHRNLASRRRDVVHELRAALFDLMRKDRFPVRPTAPHLGKHPGPRRLRLPPDVR